MSGGVCATENVQGPIIDFLARKLVWLLKVRGNVLRKLVHRLVARGATSITTSRHMALSSAVTIHKMAYALVFLFGY